VSSNLELVRSIYANWERGDFSGAEWAHPEIEFAWADGPSPQSWTGLAGMAKGYGEELSAWEGLQVGADEYRELDDERVLAFQFHGAWKSERSRTRKTGDARSRPVPNP
jgi:hypothetical protein